MQEVGGSIPPGSTSLRRLRLLRLGKPPRSEGCPAKARRATADWFNIHRLASAGQASPLVAEAVPPKPEGRRQASIKSHSVKLPAIYRGRAARHEVRLHSRKSGF